MTTERALKAANKRLLDDADIIAGLRNEANALREDLTALSDTLHNERGDRVEERAKWAREHEAYRGTIARLCGMLDLPDNEDGTVALPAIEDLSARLPAIRDYADSIRRGTGDEALARAFQAMIDAGVTEGHHDNG